MENGGSRKQWLKRCVRWTSGLLGRCLRHPLGMLTVAKTFLSLRELINFYTSQGHTFTRGHLPRLPNRPWTRTFNCHSWFSSYTSCGVNWFSRQSAVTLAFSNGRNLRPEGLWISGWCLWSVPPHKALRKRPDCPRCDLTLAYFCFPPFSCLPPGHSADCLGDSVKCRFTCRIPGFMPQLPEPLLGLQI